MEKKIEAKNVVLVTGASGAIGSACCEVLSASGYVVIGMDKRDAAPVAVDHFIHRDLLDLVANESARIELQETIGDCCAGGSLVGVINNAATQITGGMEEISIEDLKLSFDVNFMSAFALCQICLPLFRGSGASIVNIGSIHSILTKPGFLAYSTSKHALDGLTRALAVELGHRNIRVNLVMPAATDTHMLREGFANNGIDMKKLEECHPLGRIAKPREVAKGVLFLLSDQSSFMSGSSLRIDGAIGVRLHDPE